MSYSFSFLVVVCLVGLLLPSIHCDDEELAVTAAADVTVAAEVSVAGGDVTVAVAAVDGHEKAAGDVLNATVGGVAPGRGRRPMKHGDRNQTSDHTDEHEPGHGRKEISGHPDQSGSQSGRDNKEEVKPGQSENANSDTGAHSQDAKAGPSSSPGGLHGAVAWSAPLVACILFNFFVGHIG